MVNETPEGPRSMSAVVAWEFEAAAEPNGASVPSGDQAPCPSCQRLVNRVWGFAAYCCDCSVNDNHRADEHSCEVCGWAS